MPGSAQLTGALWVSPILSEPRSAHPGPASALPPLLFSDKPRLAPSLSPKFDPPTQLSHQVPPPSTSPWCVRERERLRTCV